MIINTSSGYVEIVFGEGNILRLPKKDIYKYEYREDKDTIRIGDITIKNILKIKSVVDLGSQRSFTNFSNSSEVDSAILSVSDIFVPPDPPGFESGEIGSSDQFTVNITFDGNLEPSKADGVYSMTSSALTPISLFNPTISGSILTLISNREIKFGEVLSFSYTNSGSNPLTNFSNTAEVQSFSNAYITNTIPEEAVFVSGELGSIDNKTVTITFSDNLVVGKTDGIHEILTDSNTAINVVNTSISGGKLVIDIDRDIIDNELLTYRYTAGGINSLQNSYGLIVDSTTGDTVNNNSTLTVEPIQPILNNNPGFEDGTFLNEWTPSGNNSSDALLEIVSSPSPVRDGTYSLHLQHSLVGGNDFSNRVQVVPTDLGIRYVQWNQEYWMGMSIYLENWLTNPPSWNSLMGSHSIPYQSDWANRISGPSGFGFYTAGSLFRIHSQIVANPYTETPNTGGYTQTIYEVTAPENRWIDLVCHFILSPDSNGIIEWWIDESKIYSEVGPNVHYLDAGASYDDPPFSVGLPREQYCSIQIGSYKHKDDTSVRSMYIDEFRLGGSNANYSTVAPGVPSSNPVSFVSAEVGNINNTTIESIFSSDLSSGKTDGTYTISSTGPSVNVSSPVISNGRLRLTADRNIESSESLTLSYFNTGANPLQNSSGYEVQSFSDVQITNNVSSGLYGSEQISNGGFDSDTVWGYGEGITISGGTANFSTITNSNLFQSISGTGLIKIDYDIVSFTSGNPYIYIVGANEGYAFLETTPGSYSLQYDATGISDGYLRIYAGGFQTGGTMSIDNISVVDVLTSSPPTISSASVENSNKNDFIINLNSACNGTTDGWVPKINGIAATKTGFSGSGTSTFTITVSESIISSDTLTISYNSNVGNTVNGSGTYMDTAVDVTVTNNISSGYGAEQFSDPNFTTPASWDNIPTGCVISGGTATFTNCSGSLYEFISTLIGDTAEMSVVVDTYSSGSFVMRDSDDHNSPNYNSTGTKTYQSTWGSNAVFQLSSFTGTFTSCSLKEVL
jgi:hypothetical protein